MIDLEICPEGISIFKEQITKEDKKGYIAKRRFIAKTHNKWKMVTERSDAKGKKNL